MSGIPENWLEYVAPIVLGAILLGMFWYFILRPMQSQQQKQARSQIDREKMLEELKVGDEIITVGGIYGTISTLTEHTIELRVAKDTVLKMRRKSVVGLQSDKMFK